MLLMMSESPEEKKQDLWGTFQINNTSPIYSNIILYIRYTDAGMHNLPGSVMLIVHTLKYLPQAVPNSMLFPV